MERGIARAYNVRHEVGEMSLGRYLLLTRMYFVCKRSRKASFERDRPRSLHTAVVNLIRVHQHR